MMSMLRVFLLNFFVISSTLGFSATNSQLSKNASSATKLIENLAFRIKSIQRKHHYSDFFQTLAKRQGFNGVVLIAENHRVVYRDAFGYSELKKHTPLAIDDQFQLASVSKQFTAVAIMMLKERGILKYDDHVTRFFPDFPYQQVTIRHLLTHRAGLPDYRWFIDPVITDKNAPLSNRMMMSHLSNLKPAPYFSSGSRFSYSNTGYAILASIVEKVTGVSFSTFMKAAIFEPLGMKNTKVYSKCDCETLPGAVCGYERNGAYLAANDCFNGITGDKNIYSTIDDLFLWDQALYSNRLLKSETLAEAYKPGSPEKKGVRNYGFGWRLNLQNPQKQVVYHGGWWRGFRTLFVRNLTDGNTLIVLSNKVNYSINSLQVITGELLGLNTDSLDSE
jgi:CubicO group peptidase (beta-lactamase class C family)